MPYIVIALLSILLVASAWAQEPTAPLQQQRNLSPNLMKKMVGEIAEWAVCDADRDIANRQIATLQSQLDAARKEIDELKKAATSKDESKRN